MSANEQSPTPKPADQELVKRTKQFAEAMERYPHYKAHKLVPNLPLSLPDKNIGVMATVVNQVEGVVQSLRGVVKADWELFGIIDVSLLSKGESLGETRVTALKTAVTRFSPNGKRASLIGFVGAGEPVTVGRNFQEGLDEGTSRRHFMVGKAQDGSIAVADLGSSNGTEVIVNQAVVTKREVATHGLAVQGHFDRNTSTPDPLDNVQLWSVKSAELRQAIA